jgi:type IV pilus assembly protein PilA
VIGSVTGDVAFYTLPGSPIRGGAKLGLINPEPFRKLLAACGQLGAGLPPGVTLAEKGNRCVLSFNPHSFMPTVASTSFSAEMWVASDAVVVEFGETAAASTAAPELPPFGQDLLAGSWCVAFWGHGALDPGSMPFGSEVWPQLRASDPTGGLVLWGLLHLNELGLAMEVADDGVHMLARVRTLWSNPDDVLAEVERRIGEFARGNADALKDMEGLAAKNPRSPFARDVAAGPSFLVPVAGLAAIAIPAFMEYIKKSKSAEARAKVTSIVTAARSYREEHGKLPSPSSPMTPSAGACCASGDICAPDAALWRVEPWRSLGFAIGEPHYYSYQYEVAPDGKTFRVRAIGDLDCDGVQSTFELESDPRTTGDREITVQNELE